MNVLKEAFRFGATTISASIGSLNTTITITDNPFNSGDGVLVIDRLDASGMSTPSTREFISYKGIEMDKRGVWNIKGVTRGAYGSTAKAHTTGAIVEAVPLMEQVHVQTREEITLKNYLRKLL